MPLPANLMEAIVDILNEVPEFNSLHDTKGNDGSRYYLLVDPRPGEAPDYDYSTSVQCTGTGRSTAHSRNVMYNTLHSQHLKDEGVEGYLEVSEFDSLHDVICQVGDWHFPAHSYVRANGSESPSKQLRFAERQENQEQGVVQLLHTKSCDLFHDDATADGLATLELQERQASLKVRGDPGKVSAVQVYRKKKSSKAKAELNEMKDDTAIPSERLVPKYQDGEPASEATKLKSLQAMDQVPLDRLVKLRGILSWNIKDGGNVVDDARFLEQQHDLAAHLNTVSCHTRMVDNLDEMISEMSGLSPLGFYSKFFEDNFQVCHEFPAQNRCIVAINYCATISVWEAGNTAGKGPGKGGSCEGKGTS